MSSRLPDLLTEIGLDWIDRSDHVSVEVPCAARGLQRVAIAERERTLRLSSFLMRAPDRDPEHVHARMLALHGDSHVWRFAIDRLGDIHLLAVLPLGGLSADDLEQALSSLSLLIDDSFEPLARLGFDIPEGVSMTGPPPGASP